MPMVRAMRMLNAIEAGTLTGAQLETLLTSDRGRLAEFNQLLQLRGQVRRMAASSTAMQAIAASSTAMSALLANSAAWNTVVSSSTAMAAVAASSTAMDAVWASNVAADAVLTSSVGREAVYNSDIALARLQANPTQIARQISIDGRAMYASTSSSVYAFTNSRVILLRRWYSTAEYDYLVRRRSAASGSNGKDNSVLAPDGSGRALYGGWAYGSNSGTYNSNDSYATVDNDTANFVAACNGLRRDGWSQGAALYVRYIVV